jgi:hypothetical protein
LAGRKAKEEAMSEITEELTEQDVKMLYLYRSIAPDIERIIGLVQGNHDFFGGTRILGKSCVKAAADKLELLVAESRCVAAQQITAPDQLQPSSAQQGEDDVRIGGPAWVCHYCFKRNTHEMSRCVKCHKERNYLTR